MTNNSPLAIFDTLESDQKYSEWYPYTDILHIAQQFLYSYRGSAATFNAYRREIERLLQWSALVAKKPPHTLKRDQIEAFIQFCQNPPQKWIGQKRAERFIEQNGRRIPNKNWRPFILSNKKKADSQAADHQKYTLSQNALKAIFAILGSFYNYLIQEGLIEFNPVSQIRQKSKFLRKNGPQNQRQIRRLSELQWHYVIETATLMAERTPQQHARTLFIMSALYGMYLRISELAASPRWTPQMGHFERDHDGLWWFRTVGKGNKERLITVSSDMLNALKLYRKTLGLQDLPAPGETTPLVSKLKGRGAINSTRQIRDIVQQCFDQAYQRMCQDGLTEDASALKAATVHWLRHTGISEDVRTRPREHVRDDAGHSSSAITDRYIDVELRARHASGQKKKIKPDD